MEVVCDCQRSVGDLKCLALRRADDTIGRLDDKRAFFFLTDGASVRQKQRYLERQSNLARIFENNAAGALLEEFGPQEA